MELKFKDKLGNVKYLLKENDTAPVDIDKQILDVLNKENEQEQKDKDLNNA